jgi:LacI family transcriptional regulator
MSEHANVTLERVAQHARVSLATASRVLNGSTRVVRDDLRERVLASAAELGYVPNANAQALARATTSTVGLVTHDIGDPYFSAIARGVVRVATEHDLLVMIVSTDRDPEREVAYVSTLRAQRTRAIVLSGSGFEDPGYVRALDSELRPYLSAGGRVACVTRHGVAVDTVVPHNREGAAELARMLLELGHRRFAVLAGPRRLTTARDRFEGFRDALLEAGVELRPDQVVHGEFNREAGHAAALELARSGPWATAVFAVNDVMAVGALAALREAGVDVPGAVSLVGFDDIPMVRELACPLTTFWLPVEEIGERAMRLALKEGATRPRVEHVAGKVVVRASTGPPRNDAPPRRKRATRRT